MIFILSDKFDATTNHILKWLTLYDTPFFRLNRQDKIENFYVEISSDGNPWFHLQTQNGKLNSTDVSFFFYRRGELLFNHSTNIFPEEDINRHVEIHLKNDIRDIRSVIKRILIGNVPSYGDYLEDRVNKLELLLTAKEKFDIRIPFTCVSNNKKEFIGKNFSFITKGISDNISAESNSRNLSLGVYTNELGIGYDDPDYFFPSMLQKKIEKAFEIRTFFFKDKYYSTAILSQKNEKTKLDFRKYDKSNPNRNLNFKLPEKYKKKLKNLMEYYSINTGSIDTLVEETSNKLYFLEVNPVGQFGGLSLPFSEICSIGLYNPIGNGSPKRCRCGNRLRAISPRAS